MAAVPSSWARQREAVATFLGSLSYAADTPDFWRRSNELSTTANASQRPRQHHHTQAAATALMDELGVTASDFTLRHLPQPQRQVPSRAAKRLGFTTAQIEPGLVSNVIGNTCRSLS